MDRRRIEDVGELAAWLLVYAALAGWFLTLVRGFWPS